MRLRFGPRRGGLSLALGEFVLLLRSTIAGEHSKVGGSE